MDEPQFGSVYRLPNPFFGQLLEGGAFHLFLFFLVSFRTKTFCDLILLMLETEGTYVFPIKRVNEGMSIWVVFDSCIKELHK